MVTKEFTYKIPDEAFVEGISGEVTQTFTYTGPETFLVEIVEDGKVKNIDVSENADTGRLLVEVVAEDTPEVAGYFGHHFVEDYVVTPEFEEVSLGDAWPIPQGAPTTYQKRLNWTLGDLYELTYDKETSSWVFNQIIKKLDNPLLNEAKRRLDYVQRYAREYAFSADIESVISTYTEALETFIADTPALPLWKYTHEHFDPYYATIPKLPASLVVEFAKLPEPPQSEEGV